MRRRSLKEILFRVRQEARNLSYFLFPPGLVEGGSRRDQVSVLPAVDLVVPAVPAESARHYRMLASQIAKHRMPLLGYPEVQVGSPVDWCADWIHQKRSPLRYQRRIPYLDFAQVGDHKIVWELSRHQHLVLLAQAWRVNDDLRFRDELLDQWTHWVRENPFEQGIHWTSALEVAFRALSWCWLWHLAGEHLDAKAFPAALRQHGLFLENNLSVYFSPNTHLLGEAIALHAIGTLHPGLPEAAHWKALGARITLEELQRQVRPDGGHFEQSAYYHVYALDMFLFHYLLAGRPDAYRGVLLQMAEYLDALLGPERRLPLIGDDDGGRFFHPFGSREHFAIATLATCGVLFGRPDWIAGEEALAEIALWWIGPEVMKPPRSAPRPPQAKLFRDTGMGVLAKGDFRVLFDCGPFGPFQAGHSHSDTLSVVVRHGADDVLIDPGTYSYCDIAERNWFRGSAAHNTLRINGRNQAEPAGAFGWHGRPQVEILEFDSTHMVGECRYADFVHRRSVTIEEQAVTFVDDVQGPPGEYDIELFWHAGGAVQRFHERSFTLGERILIVLSESEMQLRSEWRSTAYGVKERAPVLVQRWRTRLPFHVETRLEQR